MRLPTPDEVRAVIGAAEPWFKTYVRLAAFVGLRLGEASGVQVDDVAWLDRTLRVRRQVQRGSGGQAVRISAPKYGSERTVLIPDELTKHLSWHVSEVAVRGDEQWLFVGSGGQPPHGNTVYYHWTKNDRGRGRRAVEAARLSSLLRIGPDRGGMRRRHGAAGARPPVRIGHAEHLQPPMAER